VILAAMASGPSVAVVVAGGLEGKVMEIGTCLVKNQIEPGRKQRIEAVVPQTAHSLEIAKHWTKGC
jgi:preprotein translocase subunit YajC